jgi:hypothetical protein
LLDDVLPHFRMFLHHAERCEAFQNEVACVLFGRMTFQAEFGEEGADGVREIL